MTKISIIMPVYNCGEYLHQSINSVLQQSLQDWELLCVDDGSTDDSLKMLREFAARDSRIKVHTQENQGAGVARNKGLQIARGEFVAFLDADDFYLDADALEAMYESCVGHGVDACGTNLRILRGDKVGQDILFAKLQEAAQENAARDNVTYRYRDFQFDYGYYCFIFRTELLRREGIAFPPYRRFQDPPFFVKAMYAADRFCFVDKALYCYRAPNVAVRFNDEKLEGLLRGICDNLQFAQKHGLKQLFDKTVKRLEWEYGDIICYNMTETSASVLELLKQANAVVREAYGQEYCVRPLQMMWNGANADKKAAKEAFLAELCRKSHIYIYGAGQMTRDFLEYLKINNLDGKIGGILVTDKANNPERVEGTLVESVDSYEYQQGDIVVLAVSGIYREEIVHTLQARGVLSYATIPVGLFG